MSTTHSIEVAVLPVAGLGTRFLPATKAVAKEMLTVVDRPVIQYAVEEAARAGIREIVLVSSRAKSALEQHFRPDPQLEQMLTQKHKTELLQAVRNTLPEGLQLSVVYQEQALGLGHAVACAREQVAGRDFAVILPDDMVVGGECLAAMTALYREQGCYSLAVEEVLAERTDQYGIVSLQQGTTDRIAAVVEKPSPALAPSRLAIVGRYVLPASIFSVIEHLPAGAGGEIQLTDAIAALLQTRQFIACPVTGQRLDCGSRKGFLQANFLLGCHDAQAGAELRAFARNILAQWPQTGAEKA